MNRLNSQNQQTFNFFHIVCRKIVIILLFLSVESFASNGNRRMTDAEYKSTSELWREARDKCGLRDWKSLFNWDFPVPDLYVASTVCDNKKAAGCYRDTKKTIYIQNDYVFSDEDRKNLVELKKIIKNGMYNNNIINEYWNLLNKKVVVIHEMMHAYSYDKYPMNMYDESFLSHRCLNEGFATTMTFFAIQDDLEILSNALKMTPESIYQRTMNSDYKVAFNGFMYAVRLRSEEYPSAGNTKQVLDELSKDKKLFASFAKGLQGYFKANRKNIEDSEWYKKDSEDLQGDAITDNGEKSNDNNSIDGDNITDNGTFSDGETVENGDSVYQSSDAAYQILLNGGTDSQMVENGDLVCQPSDDNNYITEEGNNENSDDVSNIVAGWSGIKEVFDTALDEMAIVGPTIPHKRVLWLFSGESLLDSITSLWDGVTGSADYDSQKSSFEALKGKLQ
jgi:hypothetical protein